ncbi:MAG: protein-L-isoaspartate(D-aspartate) O-methyltransferase [Candidatus Riflebacteria bacterium]
MRFKWLFLLVFCAAIFQFSSAQCRRVLDENDEITRQRMENMIKTLVEHGICNEKVLAAMRKVARHEFIPEAYLDMHTAYGDHPCSIGHGQTISQPYIVAYMTEKMNPQPGEKILEVGTGSGYQAAVLAEMGAEVFSIEIVKELADHADKVLKKQEYQVQVRHGDGYQGWKEHAPFSVILVTCAPEEIPTALTDQLQVGGRMIIPVGPVNSVQRLLIIRKTESSTIVEEDLPVRFVPMIKGN